jgi:heat shock protein HslJ
MKAKLTLMFFIILTLAVTLAACGAPAAAADLGGTTWKLVSYGPPASATPAIPNASATLTFDKDGKVSGNAGCNSFSGNYTLSGSQVSFGPIAATLMACSDASMQQEAAVFSVLAGSRKYKLDAGVLTIFSESGDSVITFAPVLK